MIRRAVECQGTKLWLCKPKAFLFSIGRETRSLCLMPCRHLMTSSVVFCIKISYQGCLQVVILLHSSFENKKKGSGQLNLYVCSFGPLSRLVRPTLEAGRSYVIASVSYRNRPTLHSFFVLGLKSSCVIFGIVWSLRAMWLGKS